MVGSSMTKITGAASALTRRRLGADPSCVLHSWGGRRRACQWAPAPPALLTLSRLLSQVQAGPRRPPPEMLRLPPLRGLSLTGLPLPALAAAQLLRGRDPGSQGTRAGDPGPTPGLPPGAAARALGRRRVLGPPPPGGAGALPRALRGAPGLRATPAPLPEQEEDPAPHLCAQPGGPLPVGPLPAGFLPFPRGAVPSGPLASQRASLPIPGQWQEGGAVNPSRRCDVNLTAGFRAKEDPDLIAAVLEKESLLPRQKGWGDPLGGGGAVSWLWGPTGGEMSWGESAHRGF